MKLIFAQRKSGTANKTGNKYDFVTCVLVQENSQGVNELILPNYKLATISTTPNLEAFAKHFETSLEPADVTVKTDIDVNGNPSIIDLIEN